MSEITLTELLSHEDIQARTKELAYKISDDVSSDDLIAVAILKGSVYFFADITRELGANVELDFIQLASYHGNKSSTGVVQIRKDLDANIEGRDVLIVEDIVDTGTTLTHLRELLRTRHPKSLRVVSLLSKREAKGLLTPVEYVGFEIPDKFVVGYGLDYGEKFRSLPSISILHEE